MPRKKVVMQSKQQNGFFAGILKQFRLGESYTNVILGAIVVVAIGIALVAFLKNNDKGQTSSTTSDSAAEEKTEAMTSSTYTIKAGDNLWSISEQVYKSGYEWKEIAKVNNLKDPGLIHVGNILKLPKIDKEIVVNAKSDPESVIKEKPTANNAITENKYTIKKGDNLWNISIRAYGDGFRYYEIAKANNLANPRLIHSDNVLIIPRN